MTYYLYRVPAPDATVTDGVWLGEFEGFEAALEARDDDAALILADPRQVGAAVVCHRIVGPDEAANNREYSVISALESTAGFGRSPESMTDIRDWLAEIHGSAGATSTQERAGV